MHETSNVFAPTFFSSCDAESEMPEISNLAVFDPKPQNEDFFPSLPTVMNGVKRSETRVLALSLFRCARVSFAAAGDAI